MSRAVDDDNPGIGVLIATMLVLVVIGGPLVYVLWGGVNNLLLGDPDEVRFGVFVPALLVFAVLVYGVSRLVRRWESGA